MQEKDIQKPPLYLNLTEIFRAIYELIKGWFFLKTVKTNPLKNNIPILVIPGLVSTDLATTLLRKFLSKLGYEVYPWGLGRNLGRLESVELLIKKVTLIHEKKQQKVILIGWSMGGIFAREIAKRVPNSVLRVITIGSPFANIHAPNYARWVFYRFNKPETVDNEITKQIHLPAPVPTTALYSKKDGIVPWEACKEIEENETHKNVEIFSSHLGMGVNKNVMLQIQKELEK